MYLCSYMYRRKERGGVREERETHEHVITNLRCVWSTYVCTYMHIKYMLCVCPCVCVCVCAHTCIQNTCCVCPCVCVCVCTYMHTTSMLCVCLCVRMHTCIQNTYWVSARAHVCTYMHTKYMLCVCARVCIHEYKIHAKILLPFAMCGEFDQ